MNFSKVRLGVVFLVVFGDGNVQSVSGDIQAVDETVNVVSDLVDEHVEGSSGVSGRLLADSFLDHVESEVTADAL
jgi:hypothetical protein